MYGKISERIERVTKSTYFYCCEIYIAVGASSALIQTIVNYYIADLGDDAFYLPVLVVCV